MSFSRFRGSRRAPVRGHSEPLPMVEPLENRQLFSLSLTQVSITPLTTTVAVHAPAKPVKAVTVVKAKPVKAVTVVKAKPVKAPKVIKLAPKPKPKATTTKGTVSDSSGGEKHVDYGTSQFT